MTTTPVLDPLRPASLDDVIGQTEVVEALRVVLAGATTRGELPGHILLGGPAGTGKTTLALCVAASVGGRLVSFIGPSVRNPSDILQPLMMSHPRDVFFIDEIHRMYRPAQEFLFPVMEDGKLTFENTGKTISMPPLLFIGATTEPERLLTPMLDRFRIKLRLRLYSDDELMRIAHRAADKMGCDLTETAAQEIAKAASGVPRVVLNLIYATRDYAYADGGEGTIRKEIVREGTAESRQLEHWTETVTIDADDVQRVLTSTAYEWRMEGRKAG